MIGDLLGRAGLALLKKSAVYGFGLGTQAEEIRKFFAIHPQIARAIGYAEPSWTGKTVTEASALNISTVWRCIQAISQAESYLPLHVMVDDGGGPRVATEHPLNRVLFRRPNPEMTSMRLRQAMMAHVLTWGNAFCNIVRRGGTKQTNGLWLWTPDSVRIDRTREGEKVFIRGEKTYSADEVFHLPGLGYDGNVGYSVIAMARQSLGLASIQDEYAARFFANGGRQPYYLAKKTRFKDDEQFKEFREKWDEAYGGSSNFHKAPILEGDIELKELGMPLQDAQLLASRQFSVTEICRWFGVAPHKVFELTRSTNNNIEHQGQEFHQDTMLYWLSLFEQEAEVQLLSENDQATYYIKHNPDAILRADIKTRMEAGSIAVQNGIRTRDEVRALEDLPPLPNGAGKSATFQLNLQTIPGTGEPTLGEQAAMAKIQAGGNNAA